MISLVRSPGSVGFSLIGSGLDFFSFAECVSNRVRSIGPDLVKLIALLYADIKIY